MGDIDVELHERIARLETKIDTHIDDEEETLASVVRKLDRIELEFSRYRGVVGGILIAVSAIVTAIKMFGASFVELFTK